MTAELVQWTPQNLLGAVIDHVGTVVPPAWKKIIGRNAKRMLDDGMPPETILAASILAVRRGRPEVAEYIAGDLSLAQVGGRMTRAEYERKVEQLNQQRREESKPEVCGVCLDDRIVEIQASGEMTPCPQCRGGMTSWTLVRAGVVDA